MIFLVLVRSGLLFYLFMWMRSGLFLFVPVGAVKILFLFVHTHFRCSLVYVVICPCKSIQVWVVISPHRCIRVLFFLVHVGACRFMFLLAHVGAYRLRLLCVHVGALRFMFFPHCCVWVYVVIVSPHWCIQVCVGLWCYLAVSRNLLAVEPSTLKILMILHELPLRQNLSHLVQVGVFGLMSLGSIQIVLST